MGRKIRFCGFFFFNDTATTEIYTLSLHDALPISAAVTGNTVVLKPSSDAPWIAWRFFALLEEVGMPPGVVNFLSGGDRKSTRLNSSHSQISYAVFCLKKKKKKQTHN